MSELNPKVRLIQHLLLERDEAEIVIPEDEAGQDRLLRTLMNLWMPKPESADFWALQDTVLQGQFRNRGTVSGEDLPPCARNPLLSFWQGDITRLKADAIVNAANSAMLGCYVPLHGCIDNAIHSAAGLQLRVACAKLMEAQGYDEPTGRAKITPAFNLPSHYVLHTVGPIVRGVLTREACAELAGCYESCLQLADVNKLQSVAFCCISTGEFGFPQREAAEIAIQTVERFLINQTSIKKVIFNVYKDSDLALYQRLLG